RLQHTFKARKQQIAIEAGDRNVSYHELDRLSQRAAMGILARGIAAQTFIGVLIENRLDFIIVMLGILRAGCVFVPLDASYPRARLENMIRTAAMPFIIIDKEYTPGWNDWNDRKDIDAPGRQKKEFLYREDILANASCTEESGQHSPEDIIYIYFTSGTTGVPRAMKGINKSLLHFIYWEIETFELAV
ncbi:MAG: amino acid adenylation domain-containing protein, partial [bacterium]|nr:amino acid adenylation domain-containing protein [bacterium]